MTGLSTSPSQRASIMTGLLSTTALTLLLAITAAGPVQADNLTFDEPGGGGGGPPGSLDWDRDVGGAGGTTNWINDNGTPLDPTDDFADTFTDGDDVTFDDFGRGVLITETVAPNSILFTPGNGLDIIRATTDPATITLSTDGTAGGGALTIDIERGATPAQNLRIDANITGANDVLFNSLAPNPGTITVTGNIAPNMEVAGGVFLLTGDAAGNATLSGGQFDLSATGSVTGTTAVTGGTFNNGGDTTMGGGLLGPVNVSGASASNFGTLNNQSTRVIAGTTTVSGFGDVNNAGVVTALNVQGGNFGNQASGDVIGAVNVTGGVLDNIGEIGTTTASGPVSVTGGTLNNTAGFVRGAVTIGSNTVAGQAGIVNADGGAFGTVDVQTGGQFNLNVDTVVDLTVSGANVTIGNEVQGTLDVTGAVVDITSSGSVRDLTTVNGGTLNNDGTVAALNVESGRFTSQTNGDVTGLVSVTGGTLDNAAGSVSGAVTIGSNTVAGQAGIVDANGGTFGTVDVQTGGQFNLNVDTDVDLTVSGGDALIGNEVQGTLTVTAGMVDVTSSGSVRDLATVSGGTLNNGGALNGGATVTGTSALSFGTLNNQSTRVIAGTTTVSGFGDVNNAGVVTALNVQGGNFGNQASGDVIGAVNVTGGVLDNIGEIGTTTASGPVSVTGGTLNNTAGFVRGAVTIGSNTVAGQAGIVNADGGAFGTVDVQTGGQFNLNAMTDADLTVSGGTALIDNELQGTLDVTAGRADLTTNGSVTALATVSGGVINNGGDLDLGINVSGNGTLNNQSIGEVLGTTTVTGMGVVNNAGDVAALNVQGGTFANQGTGDITGTVSVTAGSLNNTGTIQQTVTLSNTGTVNANGGTFVGGIAANGGTLNVNTTFAGPLVNNGTTVRINGLVNGSDPLPGQTGTFVGTIDNVTGSIETFAGASVSGLVTLRDGSLTSAGGTYTTGVDVLGGTATITGDTTMGTLNNTAGIAVIQNGATLTGAVINAGTGVTTNTGIINGSVDVQGGTVNQNGATSRVMGQVLVRNAGTVDPSDGGTLNASGGSFDLEVRAIGGDVNITGPVTGDVRNVGGGVVTVADGGTLTGALNADAGTFRVQGTLSGPLSVTQATGVVTGTVTQTATVNGSAGLGTLITRGATADIQGATSITNGTLRAEGGTFSGGATLNAGGDMQVLGTVGGTVTNAAGAVNVTSTGDVTGTLNQNGGLGTTVVGTVSGTANVNGGSLTSQTGSQFGQAVNVAGGTLNANGGTFSGGVDVVTGSANVIGAVTGTVRNAGGTTTVTSTGQLMGDLENTAGMSTNNGTIDGALRVTGGTVTQADGAVTGPTTVSGSGALIATGGAFSGGATVSAGGMADVTGTVSATSFVNAGGMVDITATGVLGDTLTHNSGTTTVNGTVGALAVAGAGITTQAGSSVTGATNVTSGGVLVAAGGTFAGPVTNSGGRIDIDGPTTANIDNDTGLLVVHGGDTLTGDIANEGTLLMNGTVDGSVANNAGTLTITTAQNATVTDGLTNADGATLVLEGTLNADVTNAAGGVFNTNGGMLVGGFNNFGDMVSTGATTVSGASTNAGELLVQDGSLAIDSTFENSSGNTLTINAGTSFEAVTTTNTATGRIINNGTLLGALNNAGVIDSTNGTVAGLTTNTGTIGGANTGALNFAGGLVNSGTVDLTTNGTTTDIVTIGGAGLSGGGTFVLDIDLSDDVGGLGASDYIIAEAGAPVTGNVAFSFNVLGLGGEQATDIPVLDVDEGAANSFTISATGLPDPGETVIYSLVQNSSNGDVFVADLLNPGIGALAGSIVLTQSLIGSVINRPSSPFVNGLAYEDENPCGTGTWARVTGGSADSSGLITQSGEDARALRGEISADFYGVQLGGDIACFNGYFNGWDLAVGSIAGFNEGQSTQPVFALDSTGGLSDRVTSVTDVDFRQGYAGVYGTAVKDRLALELQYRLETTAFTANNEGRNGSAGLGLNDSDFNSDSDTFSGSVSYVLNIPQSELSFVPVAGFAYTRVATDPIVFDDGSVVQVEDFTSQVGFVGGTVSRTSFGDDGTTALNQFVTATYYNDFADDPSSTYTEAGTGEVRSITTENLGDYTELSAGLNYVKILEVGNGLNAKQLSASVRGDVRVSDQLESWGLTAQMRLQF